MATTRLEKLPSKVWAQQPCMCVVHDKIRAVAEEGPDTEQAKKALTYTPRMLFASEDSKTFFALGGPLASPYEPLFLCYACMNLVRRRRQAEQRGTDEAVLRVVGTAARQVYSIRGGGLKGDYTTAPKSEDMTEAGRALVSRYLGTMGVFFNQTVDTASRDAATEALGLLGVKGELLPQGGFLPRIVQEIPAGPRERAAAAALGEASVGQSWSLVTAIWGDTSGDKLARALGLDARTKLPQTAVVQRVRALAAMLLGQSSGISKASADAIATKLLEYVEEDERAGAKDKIKEALMALTASGSAAPTIAAREPAADAAPAAPAAAPAAPPAAAAPARARAPKARASNPEAIAELRRVVAAVPRRDRGRRRRSRDRGGRGDRGGSRTPLRGRPGSD